MREQSQFKFRCWHNNEQMIYFGLGQYIPDGLIMQYTGYKDKNDIDIYEGDIISHKGMFYKVSFFDISFSLAGLSKSFDIHLLEQTSDIEVVGNTTDGKWNIIENEKYVYVSKL